MGDAGTQAAALALAGLTSPVRGSPRAWGGLDGLTLSPVPGLLTAVLGPAGAGKSSLVGAVAGFVRVRGTIALDGQSLGRVPAWRRGFGVVLQPDVLLPHWTLAENVGWPLRLRGVRRAARAPLVEQALHLAGLEGLGNLRPPAVGAAQRQRAVLARATVFAPRVLLLDEPLAGLDPEERASLLAALRRIHALLGTTTTLLATQVGADALAVADRVAVLNGGAILQHGSLTEVFDQPCSGIVAGLLGETNRLAGTVLDADEESATVRLACGPVVEARPGGSLQPGERCVVSVRPDRIAVAAASAAEMGGEAIDARLIEAQFQGDSYRLRLLIGSGTEIVVRRPAAAGLRGLADGCAIAWQTHHATAFTDMNTDVSALLDREQKLFGSFSRRRTASSS